MDHQTFDESLNNNRKKKKKEQNKRGGGNRFQSDRENR